MERKIGEKFDFRGKQLVVEKASSHCKGCAFEGSYLRRCSLLVENIGTCCGESRTDNTEVIFRYSDSTNPEDKPTESAKNDRKDHKLRWELLPMAEIEDIVKVFTFGATKYEPNTWKGLPDGMERYRAANMRHMCEFSKGNALDNETHLCHLAHAAWNLIAMLYLWKKENPELAKQSEEEFKKLIESMDFKENK